MLFTKSFPNKINEILFYLFPKEFTFVSKYDGQTGCFEYKDAELRKKAEERKKRNAPKDELQFRLKGLKNILNELD